MEHVAAGMNNKHAIQRWNLLDGYAEGPLEGERTAPPCRINTTPAWIKQWVVIVGRGGTPASG